MRKIILMGVPHHGNIGDEAIAYSEENLIKKYFAGYDFYEMPEVNLDKCAKRVKKYINDEDIILLHGGGNVGDTYEEPENGRREVIKLYPNNKIILFPQTAYFSDTDEGRKELEKSKSIYNSHRHLILLAREQKSYNLMKEYFDKTKVYLTPDIVMTLKECSNKERKNVLLLFRNDKERTLNDEKMSVIKQEVLNFYNDYIQSDMEIANKIVNNIGGKYRDELILKKFNEFQTSELVITDRLHGMIFAAITETPCIVFSNFNHKITESYNWLKSLGYIKFCNDITKLNGYMHELKNVEKVKYDNSFAVDKIVSILRQEIEGSANKYV